MTTSRSDFDVVIIGAGPAGLSLARALDGNGLSVCLIERQSRETLANPPFDGREIAITHHSVELMQRFGAWHLIPDADKSPLREARVLNGPATAHALRFQPTGGAGTPLGTLVPNHLIRRALFEAVAPMESVTLLTDKTAASISTGTDASTLTLTDGTELRGKLIVAADTRFSEMRRRMGIPARMRDYGKTMMVCRMVHEKPHDAVATEWFGYGQTLAILPLNGTEAEPNICSAVLTLPGHKIEQLVGLDADAFSKEVTERCRHRLGEMKLAGTRHPYPLVCVYADRFVGRRFALAGDAAVGMHPVTAHGFNFGLKGSETLAELVTRAAAARSDIGAPAVLARYEARHRRATHPLYLATNLTASLYTDDRFPARVLRDAVIRAGEMLSPIRHAVAAQLMQGSGRGSPRPV